MSQINTVDFVNNMQDRTLVLEGLKGLAGLDYTLDANPVEAAPAEAARAWIGQVLEWATDTKGYTELLAEIKVIDADKIIITLDRNDPDLLGTASFILQEFVGQSQGEEITKQIRSSRTSALAILHDLINDPTCELRDSIVDELKVVRGYIVQPRSVEDIVPFSLQQIAHRLRATMGHRSTDIVTPAEVIAAIEALPESILNHRDLDKCESDVLVLEVKQYIEDLSEASGYLFQGEVPDNLDPVRRYMDAHLQSLMVAAAKDATQ